MTTLTSNETSTMKPSVVAMSTGVSIRVVEPGAAERSIALALGKSTVGSSDRCHVQLTDTSARPLHCLLVAEGSEVTVTRWAPGALLNNNEFASAPFHPGDVLQIGEAQLVLVIEANVVDVPASEPAASAPAVADLPEASFQSPATPASFPASPPHAHPTEPVASPVANSAEVDQLVERLQIANANARTRCRSLLEALRSLRGQSSAANNRIDELQSQLASTLAEREEVFTQLSKLRDDASEKESQSSEEVERLIGELTAAYEKASTAEAALATQVSESEQVRAELATLQGQREQWEQVRSAGELQRTKLAQALADREQQVEMLQGELEKIREAADKADACRVEQTEALEVLQAELEIAQAEKAELAAAQEQSLRYQQEIEQSLSDSEENLAVFQLELEKFQLTSRQTEKELGERKAALEELQLEFGQLSEERDQLAAKRTEYQLSEQGWEHEIASRDEQIQQLSSEIACLEAKIAESSQAVAGQTAEVEQVQRQLDTVTQERDQLLVAQAEQVERLEQWEQTVAARDQRIQELEAEHEGICEVLQSVEKGAFEQVDFCNKLEDQLGTIREERDQLASAVPEQRELIRQLQTTIAERDGQIGLLSDEFSKASERLSQLETQLAQRNASHETLESQLVEANVRCEQLETSNGHSEASKQEFEQQLAKYRNQIKQLQQDVDAAEQQRDALERTIADGSQSQESIQQQFSQLQTRYDQLESNYQSELDRRQQLDQQLAERDQDIQLFQVDLSTAKADQERNAELVSTLQQERETLNLQLTGLREELAAREAADSDQPMGGASTADEAQLVRIAQLEQDRAELLRRLEEQQQQTDHLGSEMEQAHECLGPADEATQDGVGSPFDEGASTSDETASEASDADVGFDVEAPVSWDVPTSTSEFDEHDPYADDAPYEPYTPADQEAVVDESATHDDLTDEFDAPVADADASESDDSDREPTGPLDEAPKNFDGAVNESVEPSEFEAAGTTAFDAPQDEPEARTQDFQPTSFIDQYQHLLEDDNGAGPESLQPVQPQAASPEPRENRLGAELDAMGSDQDDDSEEALQAYMSNMLSRMRGDTSSEPTPAPQVRNDEKLNQNPDPVEAVSAVLENVTPQASAEQPVDDEPFDLEKLKRSSAKPTLPADLSAMRELANSSARGAIAEHHKRRHVEKAVGLFIVCLVAVAVGGYMLWAAIAEQRLLGANFIGGSIASVVGSVGAVKLFGVAVSAIRMGSIERKAAATSQRSVQQASDDA